VAKTKKKRARTGAADQDQRRRERLEARREAKAAALAAAARAERRRRIINIALLAGVTTAAVWFFFLRSPAPKTIAGHPIETLSTAGVGSHTEGNVDYPTKPPVSGTHNPIPAPCGTHATQVPDEHQVHSLEHGAVGIQFAPDLDPADIQKIESIVRGYDANVFSGPYAGMDTPIVVTSWGRMMKLSTLDESAIRKYIAAFAGHGPEAGTSCDNTENQSFEPATNK
jgi:hypothetical protein